MTKRTKCKLLKGCGLFVDVGAPFAATLSQFPLWVERSSGATISGLFLLFALVSVIPLFRWLKEKFSTPSAKLLWTILFVALYALRAIIDEMVIIALVGMIANYVGDVLYAVGEKYDEKESV